MAVLSIVALLLARVSPRREFVGHPDPVTGTRFAYTVAENWSLASSSTAGFSQKLDSYTFTMPKPGLLEQWLDRYLLHIAPYQNRHSFLNNQLGVCSGSRVASGNRSPFRNFDVRDGYPVPRKPDFVDPAGTKVEEETTLLIAGQPALWRVGRVDVPRKLAIPGSTAGGVYSVYQYLLVVKVRDQDLWFAVSGTEGADGRRRMRDEVRAVGDSLRVE